jgi:eukaryotic-like serine/threonine-protein kinase
MGPYTLVCELSRGPLGPRWAACMRNGSERGRVVSIRRVPLAPDDPVVWSLCEAASAAHELRDSRISATLDVVISDDEVGLVGEYVDGEPLRSLLAVASVRRRPLPPPVALRIALDVLESLEVAAESWARRWGSPEPIFACVNPEVVLVPSFGECLLLDVGLSGMLVASRNLMLDPEFVGYAAPERFGVADVPDARSAVFSVGVMLHEMLANRPLFGAESSGATTRMRAAELENPAIAAERVAERVMGLQVPRLGELTLSSLESIGQGLDAVVACALERNPKRRWARPREFARALQALPSEIASAAEVAAALEACMSRAIDVRRRAIGEAFRADGDSEPPDSKRSTLRPAAG